MEIHIAVTNQINSQQKKKIYSIKFETYLNFLLRITDIITSRLPNTAATIIDIIIDALNKTNRNSSQLCSGSVATVDEATENVIIDAAVVLRSFAIGVVVVVFTVAIGPSIWRL